MDFVLQEGEFMLGFYSDCNARRGHFYSEIVINVQEQQDLCYFFVFRDRKYKHTKNLSLEACFLINIHLGMILVFL